MGKAEQISITLTGEMLAEMQDAVAAGDYASSSDIVREALRDWREQRNFKDHAALDLSHLLAEAAASGCVKAPLDFAEIKAEGRRRLAQSGG